MSRGQLAERRGRRRLSLAVEALVAVGTRVEDEGPSEALGIDGGRGCGAAWAEALKL